MKGLGPLNSIAGHGIVTSVSKTSSKIVNFHNKKHIDLVQNAYVYIQVLHSILLIRFLTVAFVFHFCQSRMIKRAQNIIETYTT